MLDDGRVDRVLSMASALVGSGLSAGGHYAEVWVRDLATFIEFGLKQGGAQTYRDALRTLLLFQGPEGDIPDGFADARSATEAAYRTSPVRPDLVAHKNTVETDQESSLVQGVALYVAGTGDRDFLTERIEGRPVLARLQSALKYVRLRRWSRRHRLVWSGTKADWGDVQPEDLPGTHLTPGSHRAVGIYDNAMFAIALKACSDLQSEPARKAQWRTLATGLRSQARRLLWRGAEQGFLPHLYLEGSPFPSSLDEGRIYYHGGTAVGIEAGIVRPAEVEAVLDRMRRNVREANAGSIGLTMYPPYPAGLFRNAILATPYTYQNGGDWDWFGGRMVRQLVRTGHLEEAHREVSPMLDRILAVGGFPEWWTRDNRPQGAMGYRGSAGVLGMALLDLKHAAARNG